MIRLDERSRRKQITKHKRAGAEEKCKIRRKTYLLDLLGDDELDGIRDEFGVLLDDVLDLLLLEVLELILLEVESHLRATADGGVNGIGSDGEGATSSGLPNVLLVVVVLGDDLDTLSDEVRRVETDTELPNHGDIGTGCEGLHEGFRTRFCDCSKVVDEVSLGHTDTSVADGEDLVGLVGSDADVELGLSLELGGVGEGGIANLVESIRTVGNEFSKEDLLVAVESVCDGSIDVRSLPRPGLRIF